MKKLIQGKFFASFTTHELSCDERDISKHKLEIIGRKTVTDASFIDHIPSNLIFVKEFTNELDAVEIFPTQKDIQQLSIRTQLSEIQWSNIRLSGQQLIDGVLHGIIEADIVAYCHIPSKADIVNLDNNQQNKEQIKEFDTLKETPESGIQNPIPSSTLPGCFSFFKTGCLNFLFWMPVLSIPASQF